MIYKYTRCESVIAKIMADLDSSEVRLRTSDIKEWIFEAVSKIGAPMLYIDVESGMDGFPILKIQDHQVPMPDDLEVLDGVAYSHTPDGPWCPMRTITGVFKGDYIKHNHPKHMPEQPMAEKLMTSQSLVYTRHKSKPKFNSINKPEYFIKSGWIVTNMKNGFIKLKYKAIATDERGYPLIPDTSSYQEAVYWYVTMKLSFSKLLKGELGGKGVNTGLNLYTYIQQQWNFYRNQAYAEAMMPTADDMINIKEEWNNILPDYDADQTFFKHVNKEQRFYNDYYNGY